MIPLPDISLVVIRMLILNWTLWGVMLLVTSVTTWMNGSRGMGTTMLPPVILVIASMVVWFYSPAIARFVTPKKEYSVSLGGLTRRDLYSFAFVFLGLYFILTSFGSSLATVYQLMEFPSSAQSQDATWIGRLANHLITLVTGCFVLIFADKWARSLLAREDQSPAGRNDESGGKMS